MYRSRDGFAQNIAVLQISYFYVVESISVQLAKRSRLQGQGLVAD
jgi:hypothetical protein